MATKTGGNKVSALWAALGMAPVALFSPARAQNAAQMPMNEGLIRFDGAGRVNGQGATRAPNLKACLDSAPVEAARQTATLPPEQFGHLQANCALPSNNPAVPQILVSASVCQRADQQGNVMCTQKVQGYAQTNMTYTAEYIGIAARTTPAAGFRP